MIHGCKIILCKVAIVWVLMILRHVTAFSNRPSFVKLSTIIMRIIFRLVMELSGNFPVKSKKKTLLMLSTIRVAKNDEFDVSQNLPNWLSFEL